MSTRSGTKAGQVHEAVAAVLMRNQVTNPFHQIGLPDEFLDSGALPTLHDRYGLSTQSLISAIVSWWEQLAHSR